MKGHLSGQRNHQQSFYKDKEETQYRDAEMPRCSGERCRGERCSGAEVQGCRGDSAEQLLLEQLSGDSSWMQATDPGHQTPGDLSISFLCSCM